MPDFDSSHIDQSKAIPSFESHAFITLPEGGLHYSHNGLEIEVLALPQGLPTAMLMGLRLYRSAERSARSMYRIARIDLFDSDAVQHLLSEASRTLEWQPDSLSELFHNFIDLLEAHCTQAGRPSTIAIESSLRKEAMAVLRKGDIIKNIHELIDTAGVCDPKLGLQLYLLSISRVLASPLHGILHGDLAASRRVLASLALCLPPKQYSEFTAISPHALSYPPSPNFWNHRTLVLYSLSAGNKSTLVEYLTTGRSRRLVAHRDEQSGYKSREQALEGAIQLLAATDSDLHPAFYGDSTIILPVQADTINPKIYRDDLRRLAGLADSEQEEAARALLQAIPSLLSPMLAVNPLVEQISLEGLFGNDFGKTARFLRLSHLIALLDQYQCGMERTAKGDAVIVEARHMAITLKLFRSLWIKHTDELHFKLRSTHKRLVAYIDGRDGSPMSKKPFMAREVRKALQHSPATLQRHLASLKNYGVIEVCGGNKAKGYRYRLLEYQGPAIRKQAYDTLLAKLQEHHTQEKCAS